MLFKAKPCGTPVPLATQQHVLRLLQIVHCVTIRKCSCAWSSAFEYFRLFGLLAKPEGRKKCKSLLGELSVRIFL